MTDLRQSERLKVRLHAEFVAVDDAGAVTSHVAGALDDVSTTGARMLTHGQVASGTQGTLTLSLPDSVGGGMLRVQACVHRRAANQLAFAFTMPSNAKRRLANFMMWQQATWVAGAQPRRTPTAERAHRVGS